MKKLIIICLLFVSSCQTTKVFYHYKEGIMDGEIRGSRLFRFFEPREDMIEYDEIKVFQIKSNKVSAQLQKIKNQIKRKGYVLEEINSEIWDGHCYNYAFITADNDTLYSMHLYSRWRYKNMAMDFSIVKLDLNLPITTIDIVERKICVENLKTNQTKEVTSKSQVLQTLFTAIYTSEPDSLSEFKPDYKMVAYCDEPELEVLFDTSTAKKNVLYQVWGETYRKVNKKWSKEIKRYLR